jgi:hypothetical protein
MASFKRFSEFNDGVVRLSITPLEDEKEVFTDGKIDLELKINVKNAKNMKSMTKAYDTLYNIMKESYPDMNELAISNFLSRHADDLWEAYLLWSGVSKEELDNMKKMQEEMIKDYLSASPQERREFLKEMSKSKSNDNSN